MVPLPKLSHEMAAGRVARWLVKEGDPVRQYDLLCEVATDSLVEEAYRMDDFAGEGARARQELGPWWGAGEAGEVAGEEAAAWMSPTNGMC